MVATHSHEKPEFETRFFNQTRSRLSETHIWASILYRPQASPFTRVERTSCVLVYILLTMIANAMYFNPADDYQLPALISVGPFRFTLQQMYVSLICAAVTTPVIMGIVFLFKNIKRKTTVSKYQPDIRPNSNRCCKRPSSNSIYAMELRRKILDLNSSQSSGGFLHHRFIWLAWSLVVCGTVVPAFFILLYSMEWGKQKSEEWLTAILMSVVESIVVVDPILVVCLSFICACVARRTDEESTLDVSDIVRNYRRLRTTTETSRVPPRRPTDDVLKTTAVFRKNRAKLVSMCTDILLNVFLMWIVFSIAFSNRDNMSYLHHRDIVNRVVAPWKLPQFHKIKTPGDVFTWMNTTVFPALFPEFSYNDERLHWTDRQFMSGATGYRLGPPRLRQLRTFNDTCHVPMYGTVSCYGEYSIIKETTTDFCIAWKPEPCSSVTSVFNYSSLAWKHTQAVDIWGIPITGVYNTYGGGGYLATFDVNRNISVNILDELSANLWLDRRSRAVILEFTVFSADTNIFVYSNFLVEFPETGGAVTSYSVFPLRLYQNTGTAGLYTLVCELIFLVYLIVLMFKISIRIYQQRAGYFKRVWQVYEFALLVLGLTSIVFYFIKLALTTVTINSFKTDMKEFVDFYHIVLWDQILGTFIAVLVFMATIRILQVFATSKKINAVVIVISNCAADMFWFGVTFFYIFFGFCFLGVLLFGSELVSYKNIFKSMGKLFVSMIGKSKFTEINQVDPILAKVFFLLYIVSVVFFILTLYLSILNESVDNVTKNSRRNDSDEDLLSFLASTIKNIIWKPSSKPKRTITTNKVPSTALQTSSSPAVSRKTSVAISTASSIRSWRN